MEERFPILHRIMNSWVKCRSCAFSLMLAGDALDEVALMRLRAENGSSSATVTSTLRRSHMVRERHAIMRSIKTVRAICLAEPMTRRSV